jgi:hypothetical protein
MTTQCSLQLPFKKLALAAAGSVALMGSVANAQQESTVRDGRIGYVMTNLFWSVYQTEDGKEECPQGYNLGPRGQFEALYGDAKGMKVEDTYLQQEIQTWHVNTEPDGFEFLEIEGRKSWGLNLDGAVSDNDFVHPETGEPGIDNQVYRAVGCIIGFRGPDGVEFIFQDKAIMTDTFNRMMIDLSGVDSLENDPEVDVMFARGRDRILTDASGQNGMPGGSQRVDRRWGESLIRHTTGKIVDGKLITEPVGDLIIPWQNLSVPSYQLIRDARLELDLTEHNATGLVAGFADVDTYYFQLVRNDSTHHLANGQISGISLYKAMRRMADAYPDPETGENTAISTALDVKMIQTFIIDEPQASDSRTIGD